MISSEDLEAMGYYDMVDQLKPTDVSKKEFTEWWKTNKDFLYDYANYDLCELAFYAGWLSRSVLK